MTTSTQINCSIPDACGTFGYCEEYFNGTMACECKFWWTGARCDELSGSGKQVIALGAITGLLVIVFYSLTVYRWISKKPRESTKTYTDEPIGDTPFVLHVAKIRAKCDSSSWITLFGTIILALCATMIKYFNLKSIHTEIIDKLNNNQSLFYNRPSFCSSVYVKAGFNVITFPIACFLILLFAFISKRQSSKANQSCRNYIAAPIPLDFFTCVRRTFAAVIFALFADELSTIANQLINGNTVTTDQGIIFNYALQIFRVLTIGFRCYPMLAAVHMNSRLSLFCASLYAWLDFGLIIASDDVCQNHYYLSDLNYNKDLELEYIAYFDFYGKGSNLILLQLLVDIPRYCFLGYISAKLPSLLWERIRVKRIELKPLTSEERNLLHSSEMNSTEFRYVARLFRSGNQLELPSNRLARIFRKIYYWRDDFQFSSRVLCVYASIFCVLFFLTTQACVQVVPILDTLHNTLQMALDALTKDESRLRASSSTFPLPNLVAPFLIAMFVAVFVTVTQLLVLLTSIRRNLLQAFRGNSTEITPYDPSKNVNYAGQNIHFGGYLIAYVLWAYVLTATFTMIVTTIINVLITYGLIRPVESVVKLMIPPVLFALFQMHLNKIIAQYVFLQQAGEVLSMNHRRMVMIFLYFNFFLDAFLGLISSIMRVIKSAIGGVIYMSRLDYSPMGRKLETFDAGFSAYCAFIHIECAHRHPVLLYFASLLLREHLYGTEATHWSKAKRRWHLAVFLLRNPTLIYRRKKSSVESSMNQRIMFIGRRNIKTMSVDDSKTIRKNNCERL
ncbi:unnamed protein product [Adineta ricciae]|uniref:EGF-like domain-containing protein n=1 Tax=Adineta ricciae TaxID=249248 RepID=A0A814RE60_ADIRI|nr:unnamed protein product [Adineta ricciae]CAF1381835.1 unnamed protein product [Adineta ricciae]